MGWPAGLCEGSFYQTDDGVLHMLLRTTGPGYAGKLWVTESRDDGTTWSSPVETGFTDNNTKFHFGRLPDGRFYYVGCPDPEPRGARNPLVLSLSEDGVRFDRHFILADEEYVQRRPGQAQGRAVRLSAHHDPRRLPVRDRFAAQRSGGGAAGGAVES